MIKDKYLKSIKKGLPFFYQNKKSYISTLDIEVTGYLSENPDATYEDLCNIFGNQAEHHKIIDEMLSPKEKDAMKSKRNIGIILILAVVITVTCVLVSTFQSEKNVPKTKVIELSYTSKYGD